ncbi:MAG: substrate-binding domain-containing protein [Flavobacteriales bacterium]
MKGTFIGRTLCAIALPVLVLARCSPGPDPRTDDTPTFGHVLLLADEDLKPVIEAERLVFESIYHKATLDIRYLNEAALLKAMQNDSVRCVISTVAIGGEQEAYFRKRQITPPSVPIWTDAIAVVVNTSRACDALSVPAIKQLLRDDVIGNAGPFWRGFEASTSNDVVQPLFAGNGSGVARTLIDSLQLPGLRAQALPDVDSVVATVARYPRCIGFVPFGLISDLDDPHMRALRDQVKLLAVSRADGSKAVLPNQSTLADGQYPLRRTVNMLLTEGRSGLGTGFVSFVANHKGQRIILKRGVAPIKVPARDVEIVHQ